MPKFSLSRIKGSFSKEERQKRLEARLQKKLSGEQMKYEKYAAHSSEQDRINKLKSEIASYKSMRRGKKRKVRVGGYTFKI